MGEQAAPASSPSARQLAAERGIELATISGTGPGGKITRADVEAAVPIALTASSPAPPLTPAPAPAGSQPDLGDQAVAASPLARRMAEEGRIDLSAIKGTGPHGKIVRKDVESFEPGSPPVVARDASQGKVVTAAPQGDDGPGGTALSVPLNNLRKTIARRLTQAKQTIPHIYLTLDIRLDALLDLRRRINASLVNDGAKISVNDMLIKSLALALREVPECNVSFQGDTILQYSRQDISVAVAAPDGLITPIVVDAASKSLSRISSEMKSLAEKACTGKLMPHEFQGGTATLSNLGMFGIKHFEAVINPPQAMILAIGAGESRPAVEQGEIVAATVMSATGSFDHRAVDGADGARLMQRLKAHCEEPLVLVA